MFDLGALFHSKYVVLTAKGLSAIVALVTAVLAEYVIINIISFHFQWETFFLGSTTVGMFVLLF